MNKKLKILYISANPATTVNVRRTNSMFPSKENSKPIAVDVEAKELRKKIKPFCQLVDFHSEEAVKREELQELLNEHKPDVLHFSGHGQENGELVFLNNNYEPQPIEPDLLRDILGATITPLRLVVLNACFSQRQAKVLQEIVGCVVGTKRAIPDPAALHFSTGFYGAICAGSDVAVAFKQAKNNIKLHEAFGSDAFQLLPEDVQLQLLSKTDADTAFHGVGGVAKSSVAPTAFHGVGGVAKSSVAPKDSIGTVFYAVGLVVLLAALVLAFIAFFMEFLSYDQRLILRWLLPLASGFVAGAFTGSFFWVRINTKAGIVIGIGAGFAVWFITFTVFSVWTPTRPPPLHQITELKGRVDILVSDNMKRIPGRNILLTVDETKDNTATKGDGQFHIKFSSPVRPGTFITLKIDKHGFAIKEPRDGKLKIPTRADAFIEVFIVKEVTSLTGQVIDFETLEPLSDAKLSIHGLDDKTGKTPTASTDKTGVFRFSKLPGKTGTQIELLCQKHGYQISRSDPRLGTHTHLKLHRKKKE